MALGKAFTALNGVTTNYHRVGMVTVNFIGATSTSIRLYSYVSDAIRQSGDDRYVGDPQIIAVPGVVNTLAAAYAAIKANVPAFADAADV